MQNRRELTEEDLARMRLPELYWPAAVDRISLADPGRTVFLRYLRKLSEVVPRGYGLLLWGPNGVGKTACSALIGKEAARLGFSVLFIRCADLLVWETRKILFEETGTLTLWDRARTVDVLLLDDLGKEVHDANGKSLKELEEFMRERISRSKATIVTTNLAPGEQMEKLYKQSMLHVMKEAIYALKCVGSDFREAKQAEVAAVLNGGSVWGE